ncbi:hypothetical protein BBBOND_0402150 [Babesia bigemina]|uniref:Uncharacterized protein n=1 Tax=Babesia bigemina TaxID=5866 RepID=A0A061DER2_BABBI|nr:hypothetical protein BBBOND_0402150 [Babesia bigemina]CDR97725.1 hypothetical protein BBBOND_0402150 [Babesia bigemina]|eukprot:XP_012769911.1 hypothetical protein BBBOND_0402150 [Babesia bigemina]
MTEEAWQAYGQSNTPVSKEKLLISGEAPTTVYKRGSCDVLWPKSLKRSQTVRHFDAASCQPAYLPPTVQSIMPHGNNFLAM